MKKPYQSIAARLLGCCFIAGHAIAEPVDSSENAAPADSRMETVSVTATRVERPNDDQSLSISSIDSEEIRAVGHIHINEVLNRVPGVWISRGNGQEHLTAIRSAVLTGAGSCGAFYFAEDGIPLRGPGFCNVNQLFDVHSEQAARIEVLRGPGTAVHGSNALNGVINVLSAELPERVVGRVAVEAGPHDYGRIKLQFGQNTEQSGALVSFSGATDGGYKDDSGYDQQKLSVKHVYRGDTWHIQSLLSAANLNQETAGYITGKDSYKDDDLKDTNPNPEAFRNSQSFRYYSRFERDGTKDSRLIITPYLRYTDMEFLQHFLPGTPLEENGERSVGVQTTFYHNSSDTLAIHNGFDLELTRAYLKQRQDAPGFAAFPTGQQYDYDVEGVYAAWFIGSNWQATDHSQLNLGLRYDIQLYRYDNRMADGNLAADGSSCAVSPCRYARPADDVNQFRNPSYHLGYLYEITDYTEVFANAAHGFRAPQASELYRLQASQLDVDLDEESLDSLEIGLRNSWSRLHWQTSFYYIVKDELIIQDNNRNNVNGGKTLSRGVELSLRWDILDTLSLDLQGSYAKHSYDNNVLTEKGNDLDTAPRKLASAQLNWNPAAKSRLGLEAVYQGQYFVDADNDHEYPGHTLVNLRWRQDFDDHAYAVLRVNNVADVDYAERADYAFGSYRYFVGEPRSVFIELGLDY